MSENYKPCFIRFECSPYFAILPFLLICKQAQRFFWALKQASSLMKLAMA